MSKILRLLNISENTSLNNRLPLVAGMMDNRVLSKSTSGQASRYLLAFFVSEFCLTSQVGIAKTQTHHPKSIGVNRHKFMPLLAAVYVREYTAKYNSLLGKYAGQFLVELRDVLEHPFNLSKLDIKSVFLAQKLLGGYRA